VLETSWLLAGTAAAALALLWRRALRVCEKASKADWGSRWLNRLDGLNRLFCRRFHRLRHSRFHLPARGGALVASNHVSGLDPLLLIAASRRPLRFLIAREEYDRWYLNWLFRAVGCIPVERSRNPRAAFLAACEALERGEVVALFPHGRIHLDHDKPVPLKRGVAVMAGMTGVPIIPARLDGVRGQGLTVPAVAMRSRARLRSFRPIHCSRDGADHCLERLAQYLVITSPRKSSVVGRQHPHRA
jgi:1-acyl-sn-glycerol-3-phosphate acyltransferase